MLNSENKTKVENIQSLVERRKKNQELKKEEKQDRTEQEIKEDKKFRIDAIKRLVDQQEEYIKKLNEIEQVDNNTDSQKQDLLVDNITTFQQAINLRVKNLLKDEKFKFSPEEQKHLEDLIKVIEKIKPANKTEKVKIIKRPENLETVEKNPYLLKIENSYILLNQEFKELQGEKDPDNYLIFLKKVIGLREQINNLMEMSIASGEQSSESSKELFETSGKIAMLEIRSSSYFNELNREIEHQKNNPNISLEQILKEIPPIQPVLSSKNETLVVPKIETPIRILNDDLFHKKEQGIKKPESEIPTKVVKERLDNTVVDKTTVNKKPEKTIVEEEPFSELIE